MRRSLVALTALALVTMALRAPVYGQGGFGRRPVFTNDSVDVARLLLLPGAVETPHTHAYPMIVVQLSGGEVETQNGAARTTGARSPGHADFIARDADHAIANLGKTPFEVLTISLNPDRLRGGTAAPTPAPAGVTRTPVVDNADASVTRLEFAAAAREPVHMHPYDLVVVPLTTSNVEIQIGTVKETKTLTPGDAFFIPRFEPHAVASLGPATLAVLGVIIK